MANVEDSEQRFMDLGRFKSKKCTKVLGQEVCEIKFEQGKLTIGKKELNGICK